MRSLPDPPRVTAWWVGLIAVIGGWGAMNRAAAGCLEPREIELSRRHVAPQLEAATRPQPIERGRERPVIDGIGWVVGIPRKIILWDSRVANHRVSPETERAVESYLAENRLDHVKVRINQYAPLADWRRLRENTAVAWPYRYTLGVLSVAREAVLPGRIFGRDSYNPYTATVHVYSDVPALAIKQAGHSKDYPRRAYPGTYSLVSIVPLLDLWPQAIATGDALAYAERHRDTDLEREEYRILYPAYGASLGGVVGDAVAGAVFLPIYAGSVVAGHLVGRWEAGRVEGGRASLAERGDEEPIETVLTADIERLPAAIGNEAASDLEPERLAAPGDDAALLACMAEGAR